MRKKNNPGAKRTSALSVLRKPGVTSVVLASFAARLPLSMMGLATIFFVQEESGSVAVAGLAVAAFSLMAGAGAPLRGRLVDRRGIRGGLLPLALLHAGMTAAFLLSAQVPGEDVFLILVAGLGGATAPPVNAAMRALWPSLVPPEDIDAAYGLEAVLQEVAYISGPLLAGLLITLFSVEAPIVASAILVAGGGLLFARHPAVAKLERPPDSPRPSLATPGMKALIASLALGAVALGILEVAVPIFGEEEGSAASAGILISAMSMASLVGGIWYGAQRWRTRPVTRFIRASAIATVGYAATVPADSVPQLAVGLLIFGLTLAPIMAAVYAILDDVAPRGSAVESLTWITTATAGGAAVGAMSAGILINQVSLQLALAVGTVAMVFATAIPALSRGHLEGGGEDGDVESLAQSVPEAESEWEVARQTR
jgi:MFS family permease